MATLPSWLWQFVLAKGWLSTAESWRGCCGGEVRRCCGACAAITTSTQRHQVWIWSIHVWCNIKCRSDLAKQNRFDKELLSRNPNSTTDGELNPRILLTPSVHDNLTRQLDCWQSRLKALQIHAEKLPFELFSSRSEYDRTNQCPLKRSRRELQWGFSCDSKQEAGLF